MPGLFRYFLFGSQSTIRLVAQGILLLAGGGALLYATVFTQPTVSTMELNVDRSAENLVKFISDAPFDDFEGVTNKIDGYVYLQQDSLAADATYANSKVYFEVPLATLDTGIGMRNDDMREDFLETDKFPYATYEGEVTGIKRQTDTTMLVSSKGNLTIHGVTRPMTTEHTVTTTGKRYHVQTEFNVKLKDHNIEVPQLLFLRISEDIAVQLDFWLKEADNEG